MDFGIRKIKSWINENIRVSSWKRYYGAEEAVTLFQARAGGSRISLGFKICRSKVGLGVWAWIYIPFCVIFIDLKEGKKK
jgi:hypothetical protein